MVLQGSFAWTDLRTVTTIAVGQDFALDQVSLDNHPDEHF
jgi:hypothetical protein